MEYNRGDEKLAIKGRATVGTTISIINADTGETLADGIPVKGGKWRVKIKNIGSALENITVFTSNGCSVDENVGPEEDNEYHHADDDEHEDDDGHDDDDHED